MPLLILLMDRTKVAAERVDIGESVNSATRKTVFMIGGWDFSVSFCSHFSLLSVSTSVAQHNRAFACTRYVTNTDLA